MNIYPQILCMKKKIGYNHHGAVENLKKFVLDQNSTIKKHNSKKIIEFR